MRSYDNHNFHNYTAQENNMYRLCKSAKHVTKCETNVILTSSVVIVRNDERRDLEQDAGDFRTYFQRASICHDATRTT